MTIGQVTISAADWLAARVSDRMALVVAGQRTDLVEQAGSKAIQPAEESSGAQIERRARERSILIAQESYKRVAQRIKSRLANPLTPPDPQAIPRTAEERAAMIESLRDSPKLATTLVAAEGKTETPSQTTSQSRPEAVFGLVEADPKKAEDRQAAPVDEKEKEAILDEMIRVTIEREDAFKASDTAPVFEKGLWDDLFVAEHLSQEA